MIDLSLIAGFDWDDGNTRKNEKDGVTQSEAEEVFFNQPLLLLEDARHGGQLVFRFDGGRDVDGVDA